MCETDELKGYWCGDVVSQSPLTFLTSQVSVKEALYLTMEMRATSKK